MTGAPPRLSILIPSADRPGGLGRLLASLAAQRGCDLSRVEALAVWHGRDAAARRAYRRLLASPPFPVGAAERPHADGPSAFRNALARQALSPLLLFLDDDTEAHPFLLRETLRHAEATADDLFGGRAHTVPPPGAPSALARALARLDATWRAPARDGEGRVRFVPGLLLAVRREAFEACGGFDETLRVAEDSDLCLRLFARGATLGDAPAMAVRHLGPSTPAALLVRFLRYGAGNGRLRRRGQGYPAPRARSVAGALLRALRPGDPAASALDAARLLAYHAGQAAGFVLG